MKILPVQWEPDGPQAIALRVMPPGMTLSKPQPGRDHEGKPAYRIVIMQSGMVLRECIRAL